MMKTKEDITQEIQNKFVYHRPTPNQVLRYNDLRTAFRSLALLIVDMTPICADQTVALRKLHETSMAVNATIACNEDEESKYA